MSCMERLLLIPLWTFLHLHVLEFLEGMHCTLEDRSIRLAAGTKACSGTRPGACNGSSLKLLKRNHLI